MKPLVEKIICDHFGVTVKQLHGRRRDGKIPWARQVAYWIFREAFQMTGPGVADYFERKDHNAVYSGIQNVRDKMDVYPGIQAELTSLRAQILATITPPFP